MRIRVLFLIPSLENGGAEKVLVNLVNNMDFDKYEITVQTIFDYGVNKQKLNPTVKYKSLLLKPFRGYSRIIAVIPPRILYSVIVRDHYDVCISYLEGSSAKIISGCNDPHTKKIAWIHTIMDTERRFRIGFVNSKMAVKTYGLYDRISFVSKDVMRAFYKTSKLPASHGKVIYNTNETEKIRTMAKEPIQDIAIGHGSFNICCVGKITPNKGFDRLARILNQMRNESPSLHIYAIGVGEQQEEIKRYLKTNKLENRYTFVGYRDNPYKYVAACDLYVCASHKEGFSTAVTEALVVGTPVVSTDCSGARELLGEHNEYGIVTENSEEGIAEGIRQLLNNRELLMYYKRQAVLRGALFSTFNTVHAAESLIDEVLNE